jgi:Galactose oxidase, central domain/Kelch motif
MHPGTPLEKCRPLFGFPWLVACCRCLRSADRRIAVLLLFLGAGMMPAQLRAGNPGVFEETGSLVTPTWGNLATLLPNGKVLFQGQLYDPASGIWTETGHGSTSLAATLLPNGKVLTEGGQSFNGHVTEGRPYSSVYTPANGTWTDTANLTTARYNHAATLLANGKVLVSGGVDILALAAAELFDSATATWSATGSLLTPRADHSSTLLLDGKVLIAGGDSGYGNGVLASAELYDPATGTWTATGSMGVSRCLHTATLLPNGKVLVIGGVDGDNFTHPLASAELFDPASGTWTMTGSLGSTRRSNTTTLLPDGKVLVAGGDAGVPVLSSAELYDPESGAWLPTGGLVTARSHPSAALLPNGKVLIAGGFDENRNILSSAELYVGPTVSPTLLNISTRTRILTGDRVLIGGFIITGTELKRVLIRGMGPSLNGVGVSLSDPTLELHQGNVTVATNDNWKMRPDGTSQQADIEATTIPPSNDLESAVLVVLSPGAYTATLSGKDGGIGVGLVEVYDLGQGVGSQPANISTRGFVDTGDNVLIGGVIVGGGSSGGMARVMVRALGPTVPVTGALLDPTLELWDGNGAVIAANDNWKTRPDGSSQQAEIEATTIPPTNDLESALVQTLPVGNYTAIVRGVNNTTGVGLVEVYNLQ